MGGNKDRKNAIERREKTILVTPGSMLWKDEGQALAIRLFVTLFVDGDLSIIDSLIFRYGYIPISEARRVQPSVTVL